MGKQTERTAQFFQWVKMKEKSVIFFFSKFLPGWRSRVKYFKKGETTFIQKIFNESFLIIVYTEIIDFMNIQILYNIWKHMKEKHFCIYWDIQDDIRRITIIQLFSLLTFINIRKFYLICLFNILKLKFTLLEIHNIKAYLTCHE